MFCSTLLITHFENSGFVSYLIMLYLVVSIISLIFIAGLYIHINSDKKRNKTWPITFLKIFCEILLPILFLPFLEIFLTIFKCKRNLNGSQMHIIYTDTQCYSGSYIAHVIISSLIMILFLFLSFIVAVLYYECRYNSQNFNAKLKIIKIIIFI